MIRLRSVYQYSGVYMIKNRVNDKVYIGSSLDIEQRLSQHRRDLKNGKHPNADMQKDYDAKHGFDFDILYVEVIPKHSDKNRVNLRLIEKEYIDKYGAIDTGYNANGIGFFKPDEREVTQI